MAKTKVKKAAKKTAKKEETVNLLVTDEHINCLIKEIDKINARIDRLVASLSTSKPIKKDM